MSSAEDRPPKKTLGKKASIYLGLSPEPSPRPEERTPLRILRGVGSAVAVVIILWISHHQPWWVTAVAVVVVGVLVGLVLRAAVWVTRRRS